MDYQVSTAIENINFFHQHQQPIVFVFVCFLHNKMAVKKLSKSLKTGAAAKIMVRLRQAVAGIMPPACCIGSFESLPLFSVNLKGVSDITKNRLLSLSSVERVKGAKSPLRVQSNRFAELFKDQQTSQRGKICPAVNRLVAVLGIFWCLLRREWDSFAFFAFGKKLWFGSVKPSPATCHWHVALDRSNPFLFSPPKKERTAWWRFFLFLAERKGFEPLRRY